MSLHVHVQRACIYLYSDLFGTCCRVITDKKRMYNSIVCVWGELVANIQACRYFNSYHFIINFGVKSFVDCFHTEV